MQKVDMIYGIGVKHKRCHYNQKIILTNIYNIKKRSNLKKNNTENEKENYNQENMLSLKLSNNQYLNHDYYDESNSDYNYDKNNYNVNNNNGTINSFCQITQDLLIELIWKVKLW